MSSGLPAHVEEADLISYGLLGLINAIERFDLSREIKFETYAITRIKGAIIDELRALDWVPRSVRARAREIEKAHAKLEHRLHRTPTDEEMARELQISTAEFQEALVKISTSTVVALDELWAVSDSSGDAVSLLDTLHDPDAPDPEQLLAQSEVKDRLADAIAALPEREKLVIALYYYENLTLREIGEVLGVTESRISQLHTKAVLRLKSPPAGRQPARLSLESLAFIPSQSEERGAPGMPHAADRIRNVALVGHRGSGKTSLHEALMFEAGATTRLGSVADGTTVSDADEDEKSRGMSISASLASFEWRDVKVNLIDTPGEPSFIADSLGALRVCESAIFVVNGVMGVEVSTRRLWERAQELGVARLVYVNMLDRERADFFRALDSLKEAFGPHVVATEIPIGSEHDLTGLIDLVDMKAYTYDAGDCTEIPIPDDLADLAQEYREKLMDEVAENSEALMERYLEGEEISHDEIVNALEDGTDHGHIFPVTCGVATTRLGANRLLDAIVDDLPSPVQHASVEVEEGFTLEPDPDGEMFAYVFKTRADPFAGRINLFRVYQGTMTHDTQVMNTRTHHKERVGQLLVPRGKDVSHSDAFGPGDIGAVAKLKETHAGDWLAARDQPIHMPRIKLPAPVMAFAMEPKNKGDEDKVYTALRRLQEEDPTIDLHRDEQTRRADRGRPVADPRRGDHRPHAQPLRRRGHAQAAAGALPGDDPRLGEGPRAPQEADRRPRPVRRLPHRDRAADRGRLRVRQRDQGRRDPARLHPGGREGRARGDASGGGGRLPGQGRARAAVRRLLPHRRLVGDGVQAGRLDRDEAGARAGRRGAAGADHARDLLRPRRERGRRDGRPELPPRPRRWAPRPWAG